jgi:hypothetical protein
MKKIIRLTESDLTRLVKRVIAETDTDSKVEFLKLDKKLKEKYYNDVCKMGKSLPKDFRKMDTTLKLEQHKLLYITIPIYLNQEQANQLDYSMVKFIWTKYSIRAQGLHYHLGTTVFH